MASLRDPGVLDSPAALVPLARAGDRAAFARLVRLFRTDMVRVAWLVAGDAAVAAEAATEAWPVASNRLGRLVEPSRIRQWLCAIAAQEARDLLRRRPHRVAQPFADVPGQAAQFAAGPAPPGSGPDLAGAMGRLPVDDRLLLALLHVAELAPDELGRATGMTPAAALARAGELQASLGPALAGGNDGGASIAARLRVLADIPVAPVDIDHEAYRAIVTRNDRRIRLASVVIAAVAAILAVSIQYLAGPSSLPSAPDASASPAATMDPTPASPEPDP